MGKEYCDPDDCFRPPEIPVLVRCLHCGREYESYEIAWVADASCPGGGCWVCPTPECDGRGFGFDILPVDPNYHDEHGGWVEFEDEIDPPLDWEDDWEDDFGSGHTDGDRPW